MWKDVTSSPLPEYIEDHEASRMIRHIATCSILRPALPLSLKQIGSKVALAQTIHLFASAPGENRLRRTQAISQIMTTRFLGHGTLLRRIQATILVSQEHQNGTRLKDLAELHCTTNSHGCCHISNVVDLAEKFPIPINHISWIQFQCNDDTVITIIRAGL